MTTHDHLGREFKSNTLVRLALNAALLAHNNAHCCVEIYTTNKVDFAKSHQTVSINLGRQVGHSLWIAHTANSDDIIFVRNCQNIEYFENHAPRCANIRVVDFLDGVPLNVSQVFIDTASFINKKFIDAIYKKFAGIATKFILIG